MSGRILVVDDIATNRLLLRVKLASAYYEVLLADCGEQAIARATNDQPDIVLLDVMMPGLDGYEVCRTLKAAPETAHIPVIMVTALNTREERLRGLQAGADDFLSKPINDLALFARVRNLMRMKMMLDELHMRDLTARELGLEEQPPLTEAPWDWATVMLAPSDRAVGERWAAVLASELGITPILSLSEREALNMASLEGPDAFVVHHSLNEGGDGLRLLSQLRARPETRQAAFILVVNDGDVNTAARGLDLGATDYIMAGCDTCELIARLRSQLRRKRYSDQLRNNLRDGLKLAVVDPLTGLFNRRYAMRRLERMMQSAEETGNSFAVMMLDLDRFKAINDTHGHNAGDAVLKQLGRRLQENVRGVDLVARFGGEEFFVAMPDTDRSGALIAAERLRTAVESKPFLLPEDTTMLGVTVSIGVGLCTADDRDIAAVIRRADQALYASKGGGRNRVSVSANAA